MGEIREKIRTLRKRVGLTQAELAEKSGIPLATIRQYERGKFEPKYDKLKLLSEALDAPVACFTEDMPVETAEDILKPSQIAKQDANKPRLSLVPMQIVWDIAKVREYAVQHKYFDKDNWMQVEPERLIEALIRHAFRFIDDPYGLDDETGLPHLYHLETNACFLSVLLKSEFEKRMKENEDAVHTT